MANVLDNVPDEVPGRFTAGDTVRFTRSGLLADYPAASYSLAFAMVADNGGSPTGATAASGLFTLPATTGLAAGRYRWNIVATKLADGAKAVVDRGELVVEPGLVGTVGDVRSHARRVLEALEAAIERRASSSQLEVELPDGRRVRHMTLAEQMKARDLYRREVQAEERAARLARGANVSNVLKVRL